MKQIKFIFSILFVALLAGCSDEDSDTTFADNADAPQNITALFTISQDNTGLVTIAPHGEGVVSYEVFFGDATAEPSALGAGERVNHTYAEGQYSVKIIATGINGKTTEVTLPLTVTFIQPENLLATITPTVGNPFQINVTAEADYETYFEIFFGDDPLAAPVQYNEGGAPVTHTYTTIGTYTVTVIAYSGGAATAVYTQDITINNPLLLPINFENTTLNYAITVFNGASGSKVANPHSGGINTSANVAAMTPAAGAVWTGGFLTLDSPVNLSANKFIRVKIWSPAAGVPVLLKLEHLTDGAIGVEATAVTSVANQWEELVFDYTAASTTQQYSKLVFFFNAAGSGTGDTYYFDDIVQSATGVPLAFPITFEQGGVDYTFTDFQGAATTVINNPHNDTANPSSKVAQFFKPNASQVWAGSFLTLTDPIDFTTNKIIKMKVWSPTTGTPVIVKFENAAGANNIERVVSTTVANQWEELTFNFNDIVSANNYIKIVIFFGGGQPGTGANYYFDDIQLTN
ncbi:hypothetical protein [uncultured Flavobacterium sp.]|uniref:PKD domain-containing protein n=1 Tax=uncultured Flavobacterium sp. TaxID=165435 RepID=UPI0025E13553|nr:hypothetical protein [uncultured Flavobacterium sp.]